MTQRPRRPLSFVVPLVASFALAAGTVSAVAADDLTVAPEPLNTEQAPQPARGLIVKLDAGADASVRDLVDDVASELPDDVTVEDTETGDELGLLSLSDEVEASDLDGAIDELEANPDVDWAVPNGIRLPTATANDTYFNQMWNLHGTYGVRANTAWDVTVGSRNVRVGVIDTGAIVNHPDLKGQFVAGRDFVDDEYRCRNRACSKISYRRTYVSANDKNSWDASPADPGDWRGASTCAYMSPSDSTWHGTHVAGTIAAKRSNNEGIVGVAPGVRIQPIRALGRCGGTDWDIAMSILWASGVNVNAYDKRHGKIPVNPTPSKVINLSLGAPANSISAAAQICKLYSSVARTARSRGTTVVAAAGNNGIDHRYNVPSSCGGFIAVAATNSAGAVPAFSNYGSGIDIAAPGASIRSAFNEGQEAPGANVYELMSGTSMAAPHVAGAAALAYSVGITHPDVVERVLKATARPTPGCSTFACGAGLVDANAVVKAKAPISAPQVLGRRSPGYTLTARPGAWRNGAAVQLAWYRGSTVVARGATYRPRKADLGRTFTVRATASNGHPGIFHQSSFQVKSRTTTKFTAPKKAKKSTRIKVKVKVRSQYGRPYGTIRVYDGKKRLVVKKIKAAKNGRITITLPKLKRKGKHRIRVVYSGNAKQWSSSKRKVVRIR